MLLKKTFSLSLTIFLCVILYFLIGFFIPKEKFFYLLITFIFLFLFQFILLKKKISLKAIFFIGLLFRLTLILSIPQLSQDFYRFIWDGSIQILGINPYLYKPEALVNLIQFPLSDLIYSKMGRLSSINFSNYPPLSQYLFYLSAYFNNGEIIKPVLTIKIIYLLSEIILFFGAKKLLIKLGQQPEKIGWYYLNPMIIVETIGNLHGEGLMIMFMVISFLYLFEKKLVISSFFMSLSIAAKLLPIIIIPLFFKFLGLKKFNYFLLYLLLFSTLIWFPLLEKKVLLTFLNTIYLWFDTFEFNASIYYIIRYFGYQIFGYNIIKSLSLITPFIIILLVGCITFLKPNNSMSKILKNILIIYSFYFFISTTVHPWYIINLIIISIFTGYFYPIVWSLTCLLSYSAYKTTGFNEEPLFLIIEYAIVYGIFIYEFTNKPILNHIQNTNFKFFKSSPFSSR